MKNNCFELGLYPKNVDPELHKEFREVYYSLNGSLHGIYTKGICKSLEYVIDLFNGNIEIEKINEEDICGQIAHNNKNRENSFMRKNESTHLTRFSIHNINQKLRNEIYHFLIDQYGTKYGTLSYLMNKAMKLYIKLEKGHVKIRKTFKKSINKFITNNNGQISPYDINTIFESIEELKTKFNNIENVIETQVKSTIQSTLNLTPKTINNVKKTVKCGFKSFRYGDKFEKALKILENIMKYKEFDFTDKDYYRSLVKLTGQGDMRTVRSDLSMLEADNQIKKMRNNVKGVKTYQLKYNHQYYKYNTDLARNRFLEGFKEEFKNVSAFTVDELNSFIFTREGLHDTQSQYKRLKWIISEGWVKRHAANPKLLFYQK